MPLSDPQVHVICLVDELHSRGFRAAPHNVFHKRGGRKKEFDDILIPSKRCYLQCVLASREIFQEGQAEFPSNRPQAFYK
eukprot:9021728-Pyramimonas_sp.AAC.1